MTVSDFYSKMKNFAYNLTASGNPIIEEDLVLYILSGLGSEYDHVVVNITARSDTLPLQEVYSLLLNHESRLDQLHTVANITSNGNISVNYAQSTQNQRKYNNGRGNNPRARGRAKTPQTSGR